MSHGKYIGENIKHDHEELEEYYEDYQKAAGDVHKQQQLANQFIWELARHHVGEELIVYPVMQKLLPDGEKLVHKDRDEHHKVAILLEKLQDKDASDEDFPSTFQELMDVLRPHLRDEETTDLPELEGKLSREDSEKLAKEFSKMKKFSPTRSHPFATSFEPPFETALALMTAPIDKLMDYFRSFPDDD